MKIMSDFKLLQGPDFSESHDISEKSDVAPVADGEALTERRQAKQTQAVGTHHGLGRSWIYETLFARGRIDEGMRETLAWYDTIRSLSRLGPFRTNLPMMTARGVPYSAIPAADWQRQAQADLYWARGTIPADEQDLFDGLIDGTFQIDTIGQRWPAMDAVDARARAEKLFLIAANYLLTYAGSRRGPSSARA